MSDPKRALSDEEVGGADLGEIIEHAEAFAKFWQAEIERAKARLSINGEGVKEIYQITNKMRNAAASHQAMRLISNEVRRLHNVADEAVQAQADFARAALETQAEFARALFDLNKTVIQMAERILALEEDRMERETPTDRQVEMWKKERGE
jgi:nitric oxide reductase large subunit